MTSPQACFCSHACTNSDCRAPDPDDCGCSCPQCSGHRGGEITRIHRERHLLATTCRELLPDPGPHSRLAIGEFWYCEAPAAVVRLSCPAGRLDAIGGPYCDAHGGQPRAQAEAERDWDYVAPASVGDSFSVQEAGCRSLCSEHAILVIREEQPQPVPERWAVRLTRRMVDAYRAAGAAGGRPYQGAIWSRRETREEAERDAAEVQRELGAGVPPDVICERAHLQHRPRPWLAQLGVGSHVRAVGAFATRAEAVEAGLAAWRSGLEREMAAISKARGGTLEWGMPVEPRAEPIVVEPRPGESAWDAYERQMSNEPARLGL